MKNTLDFAELETNDRFILFNDIIAGKARVYIKLQMNNMKVSLYSSWSSNQAHLS